ncbi:hypothetical protein PR202_ga23850 [Eleusine coracana subsp. coracana]|uniref:C3H1-type domain-containing protein n=1 Tax=Eleusine coracana subsp. coracana TaxID=191504 RepID=A0AAV5D795_ELECO|nr:hypothetical protein PR202_ga23850 [Eleusine coracana subsp. coracana]
MPLGKYYCDYCDKQFQDTSAARKRHLQGAQHQRARAAWYDAVRHQDQHGGASLLLLPDGTVAQGVCNHFVRTGTCKYGDSCRYFHPKPDGVNPALAAPGLGPGATVQQSNIFGSHSNFVGYQAAERNPFSDYLHPRRFAIDARPLQASHQPSFCFLLGSAVTKAAGRHRLYRRKPPLLRLLPHRLLQRTRTGNSLVCVARNDGAQQQEKGSH